MLSDKILVIMIKNYVHLPEYTLSTPVDRNKHITTIGLIHKQKLCVLLGIYVVKIVLDGMYRQTIRKMSHYFVTYAEMRVHAALSLTSPWCFVKLFTCIYFRNLVFFTRHLKSVLAFLRRFLLEALQKAKTSV